jgi:DNA-binding response OmpR family regulator
MMNILIIDDDEDVLIRLEHTLEAEGCRTTTAWSGRAAVSIAQKSQFDVLLVDEHLNDMESAILVERLMELQPEASLVLMHTRMESAKSFSHPDNRAVCKWDDDEVKTRIRKLAA